MPLRITLLDLRVRENTFVGANDLGSLAAALRGHGHEVAVARSVLESEPGGPEAWRAGLAAFVRDGRFDLVVVPRTWDATIVEALRTGLMAGARLVRLTEGVTAALDERFDFVVDEAGLFALAAGEEPQKARWRPSSAREIRERRRDAPSLPVLAPEQVVHVGGGEASPLERAARASIHGPAAGCPFLLDTVKNPLFARVPMERDAIQTRGCSFCLDNTGAYAMPTEAEVVATWLARLKAHKAADPALREVLLTDERPHPFLPALMRAVRDEGLGPLEILWKSRVDWLLEFADGPVAEALSLAQATGSVLHLYLIGFEAFDPFHLELFNKGVTVADNLRAIAKVRELAGRFPKAFEFRRHRAHGVVLFTPWTRPEHVIENARVMRQVGFGEFRSEVFKTRLRLYPRVPLHAMALADGLVVDRFDASRPDRAIEQGYDASVPWRFQDPRTEVVFEATGKLIQARRGRLEETDVLEITAEYALRWPGLAAAPDVAHLPLAHTLDTLGDPFAMCQHGAAKLAAYDLELEGLREGDRTACLKENVAAGDVDGMLRAYRAMGFAAGVAGRHGFVGGADAHTRGASHAVVAVAKDGATLAKAVALFAAHAVDRGPGPIREMAVLLGYPSCCADAFAGNPARGDNLENERAMFRRAPEAALHPLLHRLTRTRLVSHFPCRPDCEPSIRLASRVFDRQRALSADGAAWILGQLERPILFLDYDRRAQVAGRWEGERFVVESWQQLGDAWQGVAPAQVTALRLASNGVALELEGGRHRSFDAPGAFVTEPGKPLHASSRASMQRHVAGAGESPRSSAPPSGSPADAGLFASSLLAGVVLPYALAGRFRLEAVRAPRTGGRIELVLARDDGEPLLLSFELPRPGAPSYAKTRHLALSYRTPPADLAPPRVKAAMDAVKALVESAEAKLSPADVERVFRPHAP